MRIVLAYPLEPHHERQIQQAAPRAQVIHAGQEGIAEALPEADIFCGHAKVPVPWDEVVRRGRLQWIQSSAAGLDHCLVPAVLDSPIRVTSASGLFADQVVEQALALLLGHLRGLPVFFRAAQRREFIRRPTRDLHGATVALAGLGGNGLRLASVLRSFRTRILATDFFPEVNRDCVDELHPPETLSSIVSRCSILLLCVPLTARTAGMVDAALLGRMPPGSCLINVARGPVVVESDLVEAIRSGHLAGAGLDVTATEPLPSDSPLWDLPEVLITPHVGAQSADRLDVTTDFFCRNLKRFFAGLPLWNEVDKSLGFPRPEARWAAE